MGPHVVPHFDGGVLVGLYRDSRHSDDRCDSKRVQGVQARQTNPHTHPTRKPPSATNASVVRADWEGGVYVVRVQMGKGVLGGAYMLFARLGFHRRLAFGLRAGVCVCVSVRVCTRARERTCFFIYFIFSAFAPGLPGLRCVQGSSSEVLSSSDIAVDDLFLPLLNINICLHTKNPVKKNYST
jgi:hypothetical protein